jgi:peptide chain release factor 1
VKAATTPSCSWTIFSLRIFNYCQFQGLKTELVHKAKGKVGFLVRGKRGPEAFKHEPGKHVVQRYPPTETKGRRHTSTITVSVLELIDNKHVLCDREVEVTTQRGSGPGGQHQNKTESAVRMVHKPTGLSVYINGRSQKANKKEARRILESRVAERNSSLEKKKRDHNKREQVDGGGRGNKVRTYNFIANRVTDHVRGTKTGKIKQVMRGHFELL